MAEENLPDDLDLDADGGEDLVPALGPAPKIPPEAVDGILLAQNRALERLLKRQNLLKKVHGVEIAGLRQQVAVLMAEKEDRRKKEEEDQKFYNKVSVFVGAVSLTLLSVILTYAIGPIVGFFKTLFGGGHSGS